MIELIQSITSNYWLWFAMAMLLSIIELMMGSNFFLLWIAMSSFIVGILQWLLPAITWQVQWFIFSFIAVASITLWGQYLKKHPKKNQSILNLGTEKFIGKIFTLVEPISNGVGKVKIGDSVWPVTGSDLKNGSKVQVIAVDGVMLKVEARE